MKKINPTLKTKRFTLFPIVDDTESNSHLIEMMQDEKVQKYIRGYALNDQQTLEALERFHRITNNNGQGFWLIYDQEMQCNGMCLLKEMPTKEALGYVETGYWLKPQYWGKGIAAEVAARLVKYAFDELQLERVSAVVDLENIASAKSLERAGLKQAGTIIAYDNTLPYYYIDNPNK